MRKLYPLLEALVFIGAAIGLLLGLAGCAATAQLPLAPTRADSLLATAGLPSVRKLVVRGNVTIQAGTGNLVVDKQKTGQRAQAVSTGAGSPVTASQKKAGLPWWVLAGLVVLGLGGGFLLRANLP